MHSYLRNGVLVENLQSGILCDCRYDVRKSDYQIVFQSDQKSLVHNHSASPVASEIPKFRCSVWTVNSKCILANDVLHIRELIFESGDCHCPPKNFDYKKFSFQPVIGTILSR